MTASRYKVPKNFALERFGVNLLDLFKEDEEGTSYEFDGFEGLAPQFRTSNLEKGRGGALGYKTSPGAPRFSRTSEFSLVPERRGGANVQIGITAEAPAETPEETTEKADRLLSSFIGEMGDADKKVIGAMGVGRAQEYGYSNEDILSKARAEGMTFGPTAAKGLGLETDLTKYTGPQATEGALGSAAVERARAQGLSDEAIKSFATTQGLKFGQGAAQGLNIPAPKAQAYTGAPSAAYKEPGSLQQFVGGLGTTGALGASAVGRAMAGGLSASDIRRQAAQQSYTFGPAALAILNR